MKRLRRLFHVLRPRWVTMSREEAALFLLEREVEFKFRPHIVEVV